MKSRDRSQELESVLGECLDLLINGQPWEVALPAESSARHELTQLMRAAERVFATRRRMPTLATEKRVRIREAARHIAKAVAALIATLHPDSLSLPRQRSGTPF